MTTTKIIILAIIFGIGIFMLWCAFHKKKKKKVIPVKGGSTPNIEKKVEPRRCSTQNSTTWTDSPNRIKASQDAATRMGATTMHNNGQDAEVIKQVIGQKRVNVDYSVLNSAQQKISRICAHAERIRSDIGKYRNNPSYLQQLYREGVGVSNEAYKLRNEVKALNDALYRKSKVDSSIRPVFERVHQFYNSIYKDEVELNNRNRILRTYIGMNFGPEQRRWNDEIERRAKEKKAREWTR